MNEPLTFINFVAAFAVGSTIEGEVVSFTSHGAMVDVPLPGGGALHCYIPLTAMGTPPPTKARQVLKKGEVRPFVLAGLDPPRRVAELALPHGRRPSTEKPRRREERARTGGKKASAAKAAPAKKKAAAKKAAAPAKKAAKKAVAGAKKAPKKARREEGRQGQEVPAKKAPAKKSAGQEGAGKKAARRAR